jgi:hypothetical protein
MNLNRGRCYHPKAPSPRYFQWWGPIAPRRMRMTALSWCVERPMNEWIVTRGGRQGVHIQCLGWQMRGCSIWAGVVGSKPWRRLARGQQRPPWQLTNNITFQKDNTTSAHWLISHAKIWSSRKGKWSPDTIGLAERRTRGAYRDLFQPPNTMGHMTESIPDWQRKSLRCY